MLETVFSACGAVAMIGWLGLVFIPQQRFVVEVLSRFIIPSVIAVVYIALLLSHAGDSPAGGGFGTLAGVRTLFTVDGLLLAGWVHYLAFDLFVGSFEVSDSRNEGIHHLLVVPCLALTLFAGPAGLLAYVLLRHGRRAAARRRTMA